MSHDIPQKNERCSSDAEKLYEEKKLVRIVEPIQTWSSQYHFYLFARTSDMLLFADETVVNALTDR